MPHHKSMRYLQKGYIPGVNVKISKSTGDLFSWSGLYRYPNLGVAWYNADLAWDKVLGKVNAFYSFINFPITLNNTVNLSYSVEAGLAFLSKHFDPDDNIYNIAIGSKTNFYFSTGVDLNIRVHKDITLITGLSIKHFSNGAVRMPNKGINLVQANLGILYSFNNSNIYKFSSKPDDFNKNKYRLLVIANGGFKEIFPSGSGKHFISSLYFEVQHDISLKKNLGFGIDLFYDSSIKKRIENAGDIYETWTDNMRQGIHVSYNTLFGPVVFNFQAGTYLFLNWNDDGLIYSRIGLNYFYKRFIFNISLKTHYGRADYTEWGIGYLLWQKK